MISGYQFGRILIEGKAYRSDLKILGGKVLPDWWRKEGHEVAPEDVEDILSAQPEILVVGMGEPGRMQVLESLRSRLVQANIQLLEEPTSKAVESFNRLTREGRNVAGAFHLTC
ncbi:MAG TPA: MTH938/NDUFAF3 family protein [Syntrophobacteraceae bacterium]|nr:MTH938/NDUFAF3 family protein [Syntrophobacteraceae bacterium]